MNNGAWLWDYLPFLLMGIPVTLEITVLAMAVAIPVSVVLAVGRNSRLAVLRWPAGFVIELFRGSSALVSLVTIQDLSFRANLIGTSLGRSGPVFGLVIVIYFILALILARGAKALEHRVNRRAGRDATHTGAAHSPVPEWALGGGV